MKKELTKEEVAMAYYMCGVNPLNSEMSTLIINKLIQKGSRMDMKDAAEVRAKIYSIPPRFKPNSGNFRVYYRYGRNK